MRSAVWEHFKKGKDDAECKHCGKTVKSKGGNTTNLMAHLKTNHYMIYSSLQKRKEHSSMRSVQNEVSSTTTNETPRMSPQPSIVEALEKQSPIQSSSRRANDITDAIAYFLAKDSVPFNAVELPGFKRLLHVLEPRYHVPVSYEFHNTKISKISILPVFFFEVMSL